jgi:hypothetical protein
LDIFVKDYNNMPLFVQDLKAYFYGSVVYLSGESVWRRYNTGKLRDH